mgnify:CR=1
MQMHFKTGKGACCMQAPLCIKKIKKAGCQIPSRSCSSKTLSVKNEGEA